MSAVTGNEERSGRETRLLMLVVAVSLAVLLLLARFRFPAADLATVTPSAAPLASLAARASFDEMTDIIRGALTRVSSVVAVIPMTAIPPPAPEAPPARRGGRATAAQPEPEPAAEIVPVFMGGLRVKPDLALVHVPRGYRPAPVSDAGDLPQVVWADEGRELALIRVASGAAVDSLPGSLRSTSELAFVLVVSGTAQGTTGQPAFIGKADAIIDPAWPVHLTALGSPGDFPPGALVFSLEGNFLGLVTRQGAGVAMVPAVAIGPLVAQLTPQGGMD
jgi:hypothetical protein